MHVCLILTPVYPPEGIYIFCQADIHFNRQPRSVDRQLLVKRCQVFLRGTTSSSTVKHVYFCFSSVKSGDKKDWERGGGCL